MRTPDFHFDLPDALIARFPPARRGDSRLLVIDPLGDPASEPPRDAHFRDFASQLRAGDLLVVNDVRVIKARLRGRKATGGAIEVLLDRVVDDRHALAQVRASKSPGAGMRLHLGDGDAAFEAVVLGRHEALFELALVGEGKDWQTCLAAAGEVPLPPYLDRVPDDDDLERYQTVYARAPGAVAAPTAGLHFDDSMLERIAAMGVERCAVTLNVGAGTFAPLRHEQVEANELHAEWAEVSEAVCEAVARCRARGGRVIAIGTTAVRALESAAAQVPDTAGDGPASARLTPFRGDTRLFITPGYRFRCVDAMLTNFHLPGSSLLMLVCAFGGTDRLLGAYRHAVASRYRFYSYGDAMFIAGRAAPDTQPRGDTP